MKNIYKGDIKDGQSCSFNDYTGDDDGDDDNDDDDDDDEEEEG